MEATLQQFLEEGLAPSTRKVYQAGLNRYLAFTGAFHLSPEPLTTEKVTLFVAFLGAEGLSVSTIQSYLAALRHNKLLSDPHGSNPSFHSSHMTLLLRGIKRHQANRGPRITRLPITASIMCRIKSTLSSGSRVYSNLLIWAACCVGFFGFLRCGEFLVPDGAEFNPQLHLSLADVSVDTSSPFWTISLLIKVSKTDQFRKSIYINYHRQHQFRLVCSGSPVRLLNCERPSCRSSVLLQRGRAFEAQAVYCQCARGTVCFQTERFFV